MMVTENWAPGRERKERQAWWPALFLLIAASLLSSCGDSENSPGSASGNENRPSAAAPGESGLGEIAIPHNSGKWAKIDDPAADGWESEVLAAVAKERLDLLGALFFRDES
ncbi:MAG: hypothetical protein GWO24_27890, partial [Akkermansiaceae bacterium]|nr:hypothetical protein [Akkermansiaceae bacterium]